MGKEFIASNSGDLPPFAEWGAWDTLLSDSRGTEGRSGLLLVKSTEDRDLFDMCIMHMGAGNAERGQLSRLGQKRLTDLPQILATHTFELRSNQKWTRSEVSHPNPSSPPPDEEKTESDEEETKSWSKEDVYDSQISPLMDQVIKIASEHKIPVAITFQLDSEGLRCTTMLSERANSEMLRIMEVAKPHQPAVALAITETTNPGGKKTITIRRV
jgi:hypothetical protein